MASAGETVKAGDSRRLAVAGKVKAGDTQITIKSGSKVDIYAKTTAQVTPTYTKVHS